MPRLSSVHRRSDVELLAAMARGEREALAEMYERYAALAMGVATRFLRDRREAEDLLHDVFLEIWRRAGDYDDRRGSVRTWLLIRLRSRALDRCRSPSVSRTVRLQTGEHTCPAEPSDLAGRPDRSALRRALADLPHEQRRALELAYFEGLSSTEIAAKMQTPVGTVKSRMAAAMAKLRAYLGVVEEPT